MTNFFSLALLVNIINGCNLLSAPFILGNFETKAMTVSNGPYKLVMPNLYAFKTRFHTIMEVRQGLWVVTRCPNPLQNSHGYTSQDKTPRYSPITPISTSITLYIIIEL